MRAYEGPSSGLTIAFAFHPIHAPQRVHGDAITNRCAMSGACPRRIVKRPITAHPFTDDVFDVGSDVKRTRNPHSAAALATALEKYPPGTDAAVTARPSTCSSACRLSVHSRRIASIVKVLNRAGCEAE